MIEYYVFVSDEQIWKYGELATMFKSLNSKRKHGQEPMSTQNLLKSTNN